MTSTLRTALLRLITAADIQSMSDVYKSLTDKPLTKAEREIVANLFNALVHHFAAGRVVA
jgi:hypothetical protein